MSGHTPVLLQEVVAALRPRAGAVFVDATFGDGGHSRALLEAADCVVWGIDRDPQAIARGSALVEAVGGRLQLLHGKFGDMRDLLAERGVTAVDGIILDLGVSSYQLDNPARGFSFANAGPLDMRMGADGASARELVNGAAEKELAGIIYTLGEERRARRIARAIVAARAKQPIESTKDLADIVHAAVPAGADRHIDSATRTFQALRIHVNDELGEIDRGLDAAEALLRPGGRLAVIAFHSLEDRRIKSFLRERTGAGAARSRHQPPAAVTRATFRRIGRRVIRPTDQETATNRRARSARLRVAERTDAPAWARGVAR